MRALIAAFFALCFAGPALAQGTLGDQLAAAEKVFTLGLGAGAMADGSYFRQLASGLDGAWTVWRIPGGPAADPTFDADVAAACAQRPTTISTATPFALTVTDVRADKSLFAVTYAYVGGAAFVPLFGMDEFLKTMGGPPDRSMVGALASATERVSVYRPSTDVVVIVPPTEDPVILLRCGGGGGGSAAGVGAPSDRDATLATALGRSFDEQFPATSDAAIRQTFVTCALAAMAPLSDADVKLLVDTSFKPSNEELTRIQQTYPQVSEGARACAEAASRSITPAPQ